MRKKRDSFILFVVLSCILIYFYIALPGNTSREASPVFYAVALIFAVQQLLLMLYAGVDFLQKRRHDDSVHLDPLTGLFTEDRMEEAVKSFLESEAGRNDTWALVCVELMYFDHFNSMFGREMGNRLLQITSDVLRQNYECVTRNGGNRFTFLTKNTPYMETGLKETLSTALAGNPGRHCLNIIDLRFGICPVDMVGERAPRDLYYAAQMALKCAKNNPQMPAVIYDQGLQERLRLERHIEINMLQALSREEFQVFVQPKYKVSDNTCCSGEALIRWHSEELGPLMPDTFIPLFEKNGFIAEIDFFVLSFALQSIRRGLAEGRKVLPLSVNQSKVTIGFPNYLQRLQNLVRRYPVPLQYIDIEVTESILDTDPDRMYSFIYAIKELGFTVSLDDFGSGYSSLNALQSLPVDTIKLDREFLMHTDTDEKNRIIVRNIVNMARDLDLKVICEGVETKEQLEFLRRIQCDYAQGYYCARPMPFEEYEKKYLPLCPIPRP